MTETIIRAVRDVDIEEARANAQRLVKRAEGATPRFRVMNALDEAHALRSMGVLLVYIEGLEAIVDAAKAMADEMARRDADNMSMGEKRKG